MTSPEAIKEIRESAMYVLEEMLYDGSKLLQALNMALKALEDQDNLHGVIECQTKEEYDYLMNARWEYHHGNERPE